MAFPTTSVLDAFGSANTPLSASASWGGPVREALSSGELKSASNVCTSNSGGGTHASNYYDVATYGADCEVYVTVATLTENYERTYLYLRRTGVDTVYEAIFYAPGPAEANTVVINKVIARSVSAIGSPTALTLTAGDTIGFEAIGTSLKIYRKPSAGSWGLIKTETNGDITTAGYIGLATTGTSTVFDDFGGGTVTGGGARAWILGRP